MISALVVLFIIGLIVYGAWPRPNLDRDCSNDEFLQDPMAGGDEWHNGPDEQEIHIIPPADKK